MRCPNVECGAEVAEGSAFCERCGTPMPVATGKPDDAPAAFCEHCGTRLSTGAAFCKRCGKPVGTAEETQPAVVGVGQPRVATSVPIGGPATGTIATTPVVTGKKSGRIGLKVAVVILAVAVVALGAGLGGVLTNWYGLGRGSTDVSNGGGVVQQPPQTVADGEARVVAVELAAGARSEYTYDDLGNSVLSESTIMSDGSPFSTATTTYDADGNPVHGIMRFAEGYEDTFSDTDVTYDCELDDQGRAAVECEKASGTDYVTGKAYLSYHPNDTYKEIKSCYIMRTSSSGSPDSYRYMEETRVFDERGLPTSYVLYAWPSSTERIDFMEYEANAHASLASEGGVLKEQSYEWAYDGWKPTSVTVRGCEHRLEDGDQETGETTMTYEVEADEYGDVTTIHGEDGDPLLQLEYTTVHPNARGTVARVRSTMSNALWRALS